MGDDIMNASGVADGGSTVGVIVGKGGEVFGTFFSNVGLYISNMGFVEWILLFIVGVGGFVVWHLKKKFNLKFTWSPKKPKQTFN